MKPDITDRTSISKRTVMLIEDDSHLVRSLARAMRRHGYDVLCETRGDTGLSTALAAQPDAVVLDLGLPGMRGVSVLNGLREAAPYIPVVLITGQLECETILQTWANVRGLLWKPFDDRKLLTMLDRLLLPRRDAPTDPAPDAAVSSEVPRDQVARRTRPADSCKRGR
jgi:two-component system KDP operon response regulator KdpE